MVSLLDADIFTINKGIILLINSLQVKVLLVLYDGGQHAKDVCLLFLSPVASLLVTSHSPYSLPGDPGQRTRGHPPKHIPFLPFLKRGEDA